MWITNCSCLFFNHWIHTHFRCCCSHAHSHHAHLAHAHHAHLAHAHHAHLAHAHHAHAHHAHAHAKIIFIHLQQGFIVVVRVVVRHLKQSNWARLADARFTAQVIRLA